MCKARQAAKFIQFKAYFKKDAVFLLLQIEKVIFVGCSSPNETYWYRVSLFNI